MAQRFLRVLQKFRVWRLAIIPALVMLLIFGLTTRQVLAAGPFAVHGTVTDQSSTVIPGTTVTAIDPSSNQTVSTSTTDGNGFYSLTVNSGVYNIQVTPPSTTGLASAIALSQDIVSDTTLNFVLVQTGGLVQVTGQLIDGSTGTGLKGAVVTFNPANQSMSGPPSVPATTDGNGIYTAQLAAGNYSVAIGGQGPTFPFLWNYSTTGNMCPAFSFTAGTTVLPTVTLPFTSLQVSVQDTTGTLITGASVTIGGNLSPVSLGSCVMTGGIPSGGPGTIKATTDGNGATTVRMLAGTFNFVASPPAGSSDGTASLTNISVAPSNPTPVTITLPALVTVTGQLIDGSTGTGLKGAVVTFNPANQSMSGPPSVPATTDGNGIYTAQLAAGNYSVAIGGQGPTFPFLWNYSTTGNMCPAFSFTAGTTVLPTVTLPFTSLQVSVQDTTGTLITGASVTIGGNLSPVSLGSCVMTGGIPSGGPGTIKATTDGNGATTVRMLAGTFNFVASPPAGSSDGTASLTNISVAPSNPTPVTITLPALVTVTGQLIDGSTGQGLSGAVVTFNPNNSSMGGPPSVPATTDGNGIYTAQLAAGNYSVAIGGGPSSPFLWNYSTTGNMCPAFSFTAGTTVLPTVTLPFVSLQVSVQDTTGAPVTGAPLTIGGTLSPVSLGSCSMTGGIPTGGPGTIKATTDGNGATTVRMLAGTFNFTVNPPSNSGYVPFTTTGVVVSTSQTEVFVLEAIPPTLGPVTAPTGPTAVGTAISTSVSFTDVVPTSTHTAKWNWGDGTTSSGAVQEANGAGTVSGTHSYTSAGVYTPLVTVTSNRGGTATAQASYVVMYDPSAGFVTGGGWYTSPAGASTLFPSATGKFHFGFDVKYPKGGSAPTGSTQLSFQEASLAFQSTAYSWLVVSGSQAQFEGTGTLNGASGYSFLITVVDGGSSGPDLIRVEIWNTASGAIIYDSQPGAPDISTPTTSIGGGNIMIHS